MPRRSRPPGRLARWWWPVSGASRVRRRVGVTVLAAATVGVLVQGPQPLDGPSAPYDHDPMDETSVATEDVVAGDASRIAEGLAEVGMPCVQARANAVAVQISCTGAPGTVDLVAGPTGDVLYGAVDLTWPDGPDAAAASQAALTRVLDASFLRLWPADRATVEQMVADADVEPGFLGQGFVPRTEDEQYVTQDERTDAATWSLWSHDSGRVLQLHVRTSGLADRSWPFGGDHYAPALREATAALTGQGFECEGEGCSRRSDDLRIDADVHGDQVVVVRSQLTSGVGQADDPQQQVSALLLALTPEVRAEVGAQLELCRRTGQEFRGIVAGTPLRVTTGSTQSPSLDVRIGVPLLYVEQFA